MNASMALHTDKYQINMMYAHWKHGTHNQKTVFEAFFRKLPFHNGYAVFAGLERIIEYMEQLRFTEEDIAYLREQEEEYEEAFLQELSNFRFTGHIDAAREGTLVFANEPLIRVEGRIFETQLIETALLNFMNFQTLIATKASRIKYVAGNDILMEFGTRRAQEADAALWGARAAYLAGFHATSNMLAGRRFGIPTKGTHAHAWVQSFENEQEAFQAFAEALPNQVTLLVDTYDTLHSGIPNAIEIGKELAKRGKKLQAIRLDSGDLAYLSIEARRMLDEAGLNEVQIVASNDLDEYTISDLKLQGARIDMWGVGTQLITAADQPSLGGVYKLVSREVDGVMQPTIKISANPEKVTTPGKKDVYRIIHKKKKKRSLITSALRKRMISSAAPKLSCSIRFIRICINMSSITMPRSCFILYIGTGSSCMSARRWTKFGNIIASSCSCSGRNTCARRIRNAIMSTSARRHGS